MAAGLHKFDMDPANVDPNGIAESQTVAAASSLALDGALCDAGTAGQFDVGDAYSAGIGGVQLAFDAGSDISTSVLTITGKDQDGISVTEAVTGVTTTAVLTSNYYSQVTEIAVTVAEATGVFVGTVGSSTGIVSKTFPINIYSEMAATVAVSGKTGTVTFDLQQTFDDIPAVGVENANWFDVTSGSNLTADTAVQADRGASAVRCKWDSYSDGAELQFHVSYNPFR
jgi:hypothetical protein